MPILFCLAACAALLGTFADQVPAGTNDPPARATAEPGDAVAVQYNECSQQFGPFATQDRAWALVQQARGQGYSVSGVFPCYGGGGRGYCFNVFYAC